MQAILISRFLINLRRASQPEDSARQTGTHRFSIPNFRTPTEADIVDDMGEPLEHGLSEGGDGEEIDAGVSAEQPSLDVSSVPVANTIDV